MQHSLIENMAVSLDVKSKDISTVGDDILRPWTQNPGLDDEIDTSIQLLNDTLTTLSYERNAGAQGASMLDRQPQVISDFATLVQNEGWLDSALEKEDGDCDIQAEEEDGQEKDEGPLAEDAELWQYLQEVQRAENRLDSSRPATCQSSDVLLLDGGTEVFRQLRRHVPPAQRVRSAAYMPNIRSPMYRDWVASTMARRDAGCDNNSAVPDSRRPSTSSGRVGTASLFSSDSAPLQRRRAPVEDSAEVQRRIFTPASPRNSNSSHSNTCKQQLPALTPTFASLFADEDECVVCDPPSSRKDQLVPPLDVTKGSDNKKYLPPPQTVDVTALPMSPHRKKMLESLGLPPPSESGARRSHKTSKRSKRGGGATGSDADAASTRSVISNTSSSTQPSTPNPFSDRHETATRPVTPALSSIGISPTSGTATPVPTYTRRRLRQMKSLRDQLLTSTGSFNLPSHPDSSVQMDSSASYRRTRMESRDCALRNQLDSTWDVLQTAGYFEKVGPEKIYLSQTADFFKDDPKRSDMVKTTDKSHFFQTDDIRKWTDEAVKLGKKPFVSGGVIRI